MIAVSHDFEMYDLIFDATENTVVKSFPLCNKHLEWNVNTEFLKLILTRYFCHFDVTLFLAKITGTIPLILAGVFLLLTAHIHAN